MYKILWREVIPTKSHEHDVGDSPQAQGIRTRSRSTGARHSEKSWIDSRRCFERVHSCPLPPRSLLLNCDNPWAQQVRRAKIVAVRFTKAPFSVLLANPSANQAHPYVSTSARATTTTQTHIWCNIFILLVLSCFCLLQWKRYFWCRIQSSQRWRKKLSLSPFQGPLRFLLGNGFEARHCELTMTMSISWTKNHPPQKTSKTSIRATEQAYTHFFVREEKQHKHNNINFSVQISCGRSWPLCLDGQGSKSFSPSAGPQENTLWCRRTWFSARTSMIGGALEKLCTKQVCADLWRGWGCIKCGPA